MRIVALILVAAAVAGCSTQQQAVTESDRDDPTLTQTDGWATSPWTPRINSAGSDTILFRGAGEELKGHWAEARPGPVERRTLKIGKYRNADLDTGHLRPNPLPECCRFFQSNREIAKFHNDWTPERQ